MRGGGIAVFIFNILAGLCGQLHVPAALATGKVYPVGLAVERRIIGSGEWVWTLSGRGKYLASARNRMKILSCS
jgi:hypothetical protein